MFELPPSFVPERTATRAVRRSLAALLATIGIVVSVVGWIIAESSIQLLGVIRPAGRWTVQSPDGGLIVNSNIRDGDAVWKGEVLVKLDDTKAKAELAQLQWESHDVKNQIEKLRFVRSVDSLERRTAGAAAIAARVRARALLRSAVVDAGVPGQPDLDSLLLNYRAGNHSGLDLAVAEVIGTSDIQWEGTAERLKRELSSAEEARLRIRLEYLREESSRRRDLLRRFEIRSPATGTIVSPSEDPLEGRVVSPGEPIIGIEDHNSWQAVGRVSESDVIKVRIGAASLIELSPFRGERVGQRVEGKVVAVRSPAEDAGSASARPIAGQYEVIVQMSNATIEPEVRAALRNGMTSNVRILGVAERVVVRLMKYIRSTS